MPRQPIIPPNSAPPLAPYSPGVRAGNTIFLKDLGDYAAMNAVSAEYFGKAPPARCCIRADLVKPEFLVEISSIAHL